MHKIIRGDQMKKLLLIFIVLLSISSAEDKIKITYIGNEGFMVEVNNTKLLIDAIFNDETINYAHVPSKNLLSKIIKGEEKFNQIDFVLVTHNHRDHFNAEVVSRFLSKNPGCKFISTPQSFKSLKKTKEYDTIKNQITSVLPREKKTRQINFGDVTIKIFRFNHSKYMETDEKTGKQKNRHANIENLGFLITINDVKIFHNGDATFRISDEYKFYKLNNENIDLAFLTGGFAMQSGQEIFDGYIKSDNVVLMHLNPGNIDRFYDAFKDNKRYTVFRKPNESKVISVN